MRRFLTSLLVFIITLSVTLGTTVAQQLPTPTPQPATTVAVPPASEPNFDGLDEFITSVMKEWKVPGLAIAVVKEGWSGYPHQDAAASGSSSTKLFLYWLWTHFFESHSEFFPLLG